ncbi:MAG: TonB-dependent receptor [Acidobacteria bacterium]|nr:TonB-dependent receptor [Acidobacteriota bacterium]
MIEIFFGFLTLFVHEDPDIDLQLTVYSSKADRALEAIPGQVQVITAEDIEKNQWNTVAEALATQPGLTLVNQGGDGSLTRLFLRGANSEHVLVLVDGAERNHAGGVARAYDFAHVSTVGVERIEIMYGPQSVLYGSDAVAGVINIVTKTAKEKMTGAATATWGEDQWSTRAEFQTRTGETGIYVSAEQRQSGGLSASDDRQIESPEKDDAAHTHARVGLDHKFQRLQTGIKLDWLEGRLDLDAFGGDFGDDSNYRGNIRESSAVAFAGFQWFEGAESRVQINFSETRRRDRNPDDYQPDLVARSEYTGHNMELDWRNTFAIASSSRLLAGVEWEQERAEGSDRYYFGDTPFDSALDADADTRAVYAQLGGTWPKGSYLAGARYDDHDRFGGELTYQLGGTWSLSDATHLSAQYGTAFRAPSLYQLYSQYGNRELEAERGKLWEVGIHHRWSNLEWDVRHHRADYEELMSFFFDPETFASYYINEASAEIKGTESSITARFKQVSFRVYGELLDTKDASGNELLRRPKNRYGLSVNGQYGERWHWSLNWLHEGERKDITFDPLDFSQVRINLKAIDLVDLGAQAKVTQRMSIQAHISNALDDEAVRVFGYLSHGRRYTLGITAHL